MTDTPARASRQTPSFPKDSLIQLLRSQYKSLDYLGSSLTDKEWHSPVALPGWVVLDVYAHIIGAESMLEGYELPYIKVDVSELDHVHNEVGVVNETWIESLSHLEPEAMLDRYRRVTTSRLRSLEAMTQQELDSDTDGPNGPVPYGRLMQLRVFDCWMHEQDIREGLGRPGHESGPCARASVDEAVLALPGIVDGAIEPGDRPTSLTIELTGPVKQRISLLVAAESELVDELPGSAASTISMSSGLFMRLAGGRASVLSQRLGAIDFQGDLDLATQVVTNLAFTN